jgi:hypothetical protein
LEKNKAAARKKYGGFFQASENFQALFSGPGKARGCFAGWVEWPRSDERGYKIMPRETATL